MVPAIGLFGTPGLSVAYSVAYVVAAVASSCYTPGAGCSAGDVRTCPGLLVAAAVGVWVAVANTYLPEAPTTSCILACSSWRPSSPVPSSPRPHGFEAITRRARAALPGRR